MNKTKYWIWLSMAMGAGARTDELVSAYPDPEILYHESKTERAISGVFTGSRLDALDRVKIEDAEKAEEICRKNGWLIYTPDSSEYPGCLRNLRDMPLVLYSTSDLSFLGNRVTVGVVGTRNPSRESVKIARTLSFQMASCGAVIVSGGALGIDTAAHEGALDAKKETVCVLGCGLGTDYLMSNEAMRREIAENGAVITEYPPFFPAGRTTFPQRNRIISGLSNGTLVVEAGEKSGSLITAGYALEQGREVFAVPGSILSSAYTGANKLIRDGAKAVMSARDILLSLEQMNPGMLDLSKLDEKYHERSPRSGSPGPVPEKIKAKPTPELDGDEKIVYNLLGNEPVHADEICAASGLSPSKVIAALTLLELDGHVKQTEGKNYILT